MISGMNVLQDLMPCCFKITCFLSKAPVSPNTKPVSKTPFMDPAVARVTGMVRSPVDDVTHKGNNKKKDKDRMRRSQKLKRLKYQNLFQ